MSKHYIDDFGFTYTSAQYGVSSDPYYANKDADFGINEHNIGLSDEDLAELERMMSEGGFGALPGYEDEEDIDDDRYEGNEEYDRSYWNWDGEEADYGDGSDEGPSPEQAEENRRKNKEAEISKSAEENSRRFCRHEFKGVLGLNKMYYNCKHCGIKKEDVK